MMNVLWAGMILVGIGVAVACGQLDAVTNGAIASARESAELALTMLGVVAMWCGLMKIAEKAGLVQAMSARLMPLITKLFPDLEPRSKAMEHISTNFIANFLGLGWAATPAGLKAMEEMQKVNHGAKDTATKSMCMFLIINMSSLQLATVNLIAYRAQYLSANPAEIIGPGIFATLVSTIVAIVAAKQMERWAFR